MALTPGSWVTPTVRLERRIAAGGMAEVWQGDHTTLGVKVAVKCLLPALARAPDALARFLREAKIAAQMNDPHTVRVLDCVVRDDLGDLEEPDEGPYAFMVMELLEGEDLGRCLARTGRLSLESTAAVVQQVGWALATAHDLGAIHRDVKPSNIFLALHGRRSCVKLLDFGFAKELAAPTGITMIGLTLGTPHYMSPEQLCGAADLDGRCDVWALAVVAYTCLTGHAPFDGATPAAVHAAILDRSAPPPAHEREDLPASIDRLFATAFDPRIEARFQRAGDLADALIAATRDLRPAASASGERPLLAVSTSRVRVIG